MLTGEIKPCGFCGEMPMSWNGEIFAIYFGRAVCEDCWESDEYFEWSQAKHKELDIPPNTFIMADNYVPPPPHISTWQRLVKWVIRKV